MTEIKFRLSVAHVKIATQSYSLLTFAVNSLPSLRGWPWQTDKLVRRHSVNVLQFLMEAEESTLSVRSKRATMDFSLLTVPCVPEIALQSSSSLQVQSASFLHTVPPRSVPSGSDCVCVRGCVDALNP